MLSLFLLRGKDRDELSKIIAPYVSHERFSKLRRHRHHLFFNRHEHLIHTASLCLRLAKLFRADVETCVLAGLLHDFHETRVKGYEHGLESARNARKVGLRNLHAISIIEAHMFPLGFGKVSVPKTREFAVLKIADALAAITEVAYGALHSVAVRSIAHSRIRFEETRDILVRISREIERLERSAEGAFEEVLETAKSAVGTAVNTAVETATTVTAIGKIRKT